MYDISDSIEIYLDRLYCVRGVRQPLTVYAQGKCRDNITEFIRIFKASRYESIDESFMVFYKLYLRKKYRYNFNLMKSKLTDVQRFLNYVKGKTQLKISFSNHDKTSIPEIAYVFDEVANLV